MVKIRHFESRCSHCDWCNQTGIRGKPEGTGMWWYDDNGEALICMECKELADLYFELQNKDW